MAIFIQQPDGAGNCCDCAGRTNPCDSCSPVTGVCCSFPYSFSLSNNQQIMVNSGCYYGWNLAPDNRPNLTVVDSNTTATFEPNNIVLERTIGLTAIATSPYPNCQDGFPAGAAEIDWTVAISTQGDFTIDSLGTITWHDCAGGSVYVYKMDESHECYFDTFSPLAYYAFPQTPSPCNGSVPVTWNGSRTFSLGPGSFIVCFLAGVLNVEIGFGPGMCDTTRSNGIVNASMTITGPNLVPLPLVNVEVPETCNKMLLPPLTESTDSWYASLAAAQAVLASINVSNCVAYSPFPGTSFVATDGGSTLSVNLVNGTPVGDPGGSFYCSVNAIVGQTITVAFTFSSSSPPTAQYENIVTLYNDEGVLIESKTTVAAIGSSGSDTTITSVLPYTGKYILNINVLKITGGGAVTSNVSWTVSSSSTMTVNPIQALYDVGLGCAARVDC